MAFFRIVLSGEILPGADHDQVVHKLAQLFKVDVHQAANLLDGRAHPIRREMPREKAEKIQQKLQAIGVIARIEAVQPVTPATTVTELTLEPIRDAPSSAPKVKTCPKCGYEQVGGDTCENCGVVFDKVLGRKVDTEDAWRKEAQREYKPEELLPEFLATNEDKYIPKFRHYERLGGKFSLGWHWPAAFVPFLWAMYRKLWGWAAIIWITSYLIPLGIQLGIMSTLSEGSLPNGFVLLTSWLVGLVLWLVWPLTANYLYYRHAMPRVKSIAARFKGDEALDRAADAGGVSSAAVVLGILLNIALFAGISMLLAPKIASMSRNMVENVGGVIESGDGETRRLLDKNATKEEIATMGALKGLAVITRVWMIQHGTTSTELLTEARLNEDMRIQDDAWRDGWKHKIRFTPGASSYSFRSAGADGEFGNSDDLVLTNASPPAE